MTAIKRNLVLSLALGSLVAMVFASAALATHPRPGSGTPFAVPFVPAYKQCTSPNSTHIAPLGLPSCNNPQLSSALLTIGTAGAGSGSANLKVICTDAQAPPCTPNDGNDTEDVQVKGSQTDVRCVAAGTNCAAAGADYTGKLIAQSNIRITDHSNGTPATICTSGTGAPPCTTATVSDVVFSVPIQCADNGAANGAICNLPVTTIDTLVPTTVKEFQRGVVSIFNLHALDQGPDGSVSPGGGFTCPPICGTGDETNFVEQGIFLP